ncbi:RHS repeat-associated core domain-containing protein [Cellulomonas hominis]
MPRELHPFADSATATGTTTTATYSWNQAGELTSAATPSGAATYVYDGDGLRVSVTSSGTTVHSTWDHRPDLPVLLDDGATAYVYGPGNLPLEQIAANGTTQWFFADSQGSTVALTDATGAICGTYTYDTWGRTTAHTGTDTTLQYNGQIFDTVTGFLYLRARYYDPATGVFISIDPLLSLTRTAYGYAANNPLNVVDPLGMFAWGVALGWTSTITGFAAVVVGATVIGSPVAAVLEAVSITTGVAAAVIDCSHARDVYCALDGVAAGLGVAGGTLRVVAHFGQVAKPVAEAIDTVAGTWGATVGFAGSVAGTAELCRGEEDE